MSRRYLPLTVDVAEIAQSTGETEMALHRQAEPVAVEMWPRNSEFVVAGPPPSSGTARLLEAGIVINFGFDPS